MGGLPPESMWIPRAVIDRKMRRLIGVTLCDPDKCINEHFVHVAYFIKCENLRMSEISRKNQRL
jgi:hypothetical protein